jgi:beta-lactam-binding protein with PASTA domain
MSAQRRTQLVSVSLVGALLAAVLAVAFGTGYQVSHASTGDGSAWLAKPGRFVHVNPETGKPDAETAVPDGRNGPGATAADPGSGTVYLNDDKSGHHDLDTTTMKAGGKEPGRVFTGGSGPRARSYVVDGARISPVGRPGRTAAAPAPIGTCVVDDGGTAWLLAAGRLRWYDGSALRTLSGLAVRPDHLTLVNGRPVAVSRDGRVVRVGADRAPGRALSLGLPRGASVTAVNDPSSTGSVAWVVAKGTHALHGVDVSSGRPRSAALGGLSDRLGAPVATSGRVYVPDYGKGTVVRVAGGSPAAGPRAVEVPVKRKGARFQVFARNGYLWVNDPLARQASVIDPDGRDRPVDTGDGRTDGRPHHPAAPRTPPRLPEPPAPGTPPTTRTPPADGTTTAPRHQDTAKTPTVEVPDVTGKTKDEACTAIEAAGLNCDFQSVGTRPNRPPDEVVGTVPRAGARRAKGTVVLIQHLGALTVPSLAGRTAQDACSILAAARLRCVRQGTGAPADPSQVGLVHDQDPQPGAAAGENQAVTVDYYDRTRVPSVVDLTQSPSQQSACATLQQWQLACVPTSEGPADKNSSAPYVVTRQSQQPDAEVAPGTQVTVWFRGDYQVPNVTGMGIGQACAAVQNAGLTCNQMVEPAQSRDTATHQDPQAGTAMGQNAQVNVYYWPLASQDILRYRQSDGDPVWTLRGNGRTDGLGGYDAAGRAGISGVPDARTAQFFTPIHAYQCAGAGQCSYDINHYDTTAGAPSGAPWVYTGDVGWVFTRPWPGTVPLYRLQRVQSGKWSYAYATPSDGAWPDYLNSGYQQQEILGYVWPG